MKLAELHILEEGDERRFEVFANLIKSNFPNAKKIADIAGGKGYLQVALKNKGYKDVTTFDKRKKEKRANVNDLDFRYQWFDENIKDGYDLLVGMHPDEATDVIITQAVKRNIPFAVVPCCVKPWATASQFNQHYNYTNWMKHLQNIAEKAGYNVQTVQIKINGKNIAIIGRPKKG